MPRERSVSAATVTARQHLRLRNGCALDAHWIIARMLEQLRRNRRLGTVVLMGCIVLWLVALLAGVQVRALPVMVHGSAAVPAAAAQDLLDHAVCSVVPEGLDDAEVALQAFAHSGAVESSPAHAAHAPDSADSVQVADGTAASAEDAAHEGHQGHHGPDCVRCIALSPPAAVAVVVYRPPVPRQGLDWRAPAQQPPSLQAAAPLPARGPPVPLHA